MTESRPDSTAEGSLPRLVAACGGATALIGLLSGLGEALAGHPWVTAFPRGSQPMVPWGAGALALLGASLVLLAVIPARARARRAVALVAGAVLATALLGAFALLFLPALDPDRLLAGVAALGRVPGAGRTPPTAVVVIGCASAALLCLALGRLRDTAGALGLLVAMAGGIACMGLAYGSPLQPRVPWPQVSLAAGLATAFIGVGLLGQAGPSAWPLRAFTGDSVRAILLRGFLPFVLLAAVATDVASVLLFARLSPALGLGVNALASCAVAVLVVTWLARRIGGRIERSELALRESEDRFRRLSDAAFEGVAITEHGTLVDCNAHLTAMLGYTREEMIGRPVAEFVAAEHTDMVRAQQRAHVTERYEHLARRKDGTTFPVEVQGRAIPYHGREVRVTAISDMTERHRLEDELRQAQRAEAIGQLAGGVAHDFNNLLTAVLASGALLDAGLGADSPLKDDVEIIRRAAGRGAELTQKLLAYSRRQPLQLRPLAVRPAMEAFFHLARRIVPENIDIALEAGPDDATVLADAGALDQILLNCITNARDAMPGGGRIVLAVRRGTGHVTITVADTGCGMDAATRRRAFEPFFTTKPVGQGTGLGLPMVEGLVRQHNGQVTLESEVGRGTTVRIHLPEASAEETSAVRPPPPEIRGGHETILVVEDDEAVQRATVRVLETFGYDVLTAGDGAEALALLTDGARRPDLILSDVVMPRLSGPQLLAQLRETGRAPKVLFTSGYTSREARTEVQLDPGARLLTKPWAVPELLQAVREALDA